MAFPQGHPRPFAARGPAVSFEEPAQAPPPIRWPCSSGPGLSAPGDSWASRKSLAHLWDQAAQTTAVSPPWAHPGSGTQGPAQGSGRTAGLRGARDSEQGWGLRPDKPAGPGGRGHRARGREALQAEACPVPRPEWAGQPWVQETAVVAGAPGGRAGAGVWADTGSSAMGGGRRPKGGTVQEGPEGGPREGPAARLQGPRWGGGASQLSAPCPRS